MQGWYIGITAASQAVKAGSTPVPCSKKKTPVRVSFFLEQHFCGAKVVACGRVTEREWGNPQRFPPHTPPSLRQAGTCGQQSPRRAAREGVFLFGAALLRSKSGRLRESSKKVGGREMRPPQVRRKNRTLCRAETAVIRWGKLWRLRQRRQRSVASSQTRAQADAPHTAQSHAGGRQRRRAPPCERA